jgi:hypothetical protein
MDRYRKLESQLGKKIEEPGAHMPHAAVGLLRKLRRKRRENQDMVEPLKLERDMKAIDKNDPFPLELNVDSMDQGK